MVRRKPDMMELVDEFARQVTAQTDAIWAGDSRTGNKHARRMDATFKQLRAMGDPGRDALATLFTHIRPDVRTMAAVYLLRHRTDEAISVLKVVARGKGLTSFGAQQALKRWEEAGGTWELDPPDDE